MADLVVVVPSRERPHAALALARAFQDTCTAGTQLVFAVNADDPTIDEYGKNPPIGGVYGVPAKSMVEALNFSGELALGACSPFAIGFMGDDHCPRTYGWDRAYLDALQDLGTGLVYGNDLLQGERLPTQVAMTADIVRALGYMAPPTLRHLYVDNFWRDLGQAAGCLRYLPEVIVEHRHPLAGKADWDDGYRRVNADDMYKVDSQAYVDYSRDRLAGDVAKVRALRG